MPTQSRTSAIHTRPSSASISRQSQSAHSGSSRDWDAGSRVSHSTQTRNETRTQVGNRLTAVPEDMAIAVRSPTVESSRRTTYDGESKQLMLREPSRQNSFSGQTVARRENSRYESQTRGGNSRAITQYESQTRGGDSRAITRYESQHHGDSRTKTITRGDHHTRERSHTVTRGQSVKSASDQELEARLKKLEEDKARQMERQIDRLENKVDALQAQNQNKTAYYVYSPYAGYYQGYRDGAGRC